MKKRIDVGPFHVGPFCGVTLYRPTTWWEHYGLQIKRYETGSFSIGPVYFWKEVF